MEHQRFRVICKTSMYSSYNLGNISSFLITPVPKATLAESLASSSWKILLPQKLLKSLGWKRTFLTSKYKQDRGTTTVSHNLYEVLLNMELRWGGAGKHTVGHLSSMPGCHNPLQRLS